MIQKNNFIELVKAEIPANKLLIRMDKARNHYFKRETLQFDGYIPLVLESSTPEEDLVGHILYVRDYNCRHEWEADADFAYKYYPALDTIEFGLPHLIKDPHFFEKLRKVINSAPQEFESLLFEASIATMYKIHGFDYGFVKETTTPTPDLEVSNSSITAGVECKRLQAGGMPFHRQRNFLNAIFESNKTSLIVGSKIILVTLNLKIQPEQINKSIFISDLTTSIKNCLPIVTPHYEIESLEINKIAMNMHFEENRVRVDSAQILKLIDLNYDSRIMTWHNIHYEQIYKEPSIDSVFNRTADGISSATVIKYRFSEPEHVKVMARHLKRVIVKALKQFRGNELGIVHTGNYVIEGDSVEQAREIKNRRELSGFKPGREISFQMHSFRSVIHHRGYEFEETREVISNSKRLSNLLPDDALAHHTNNIVRVTSVPFWNDPMPNNLGD